MFNMQRSFFGPTYEDFQPLTETKETPESYLLLIRLPGFAREHVSAKFESLNRRVKVFGERPIGSNRWRRFSVVHPVPENCEANKLNRKFEGGIVTITMPKKVVSKPRDQELAKLPPPTHKPTPSDESKGSSGEAKMAQMGKEVISQEPRPSKVDDKVEGSVPPKATTGDGFVARKDKKVQTDEIVGSVLETGENKGVAMKERKEDIEKPKSSNEVGKVPPEVKAQTAEEGRKQMLAMAVSENGKSGGAERKESKEDIEIASEVIPPKPAKRLGEKEVSARKGQGGLNEKHVGSVSENGKIKEAEKKASKEAIEKISEARKASEVIPLKPTTRVEEAKEVRAQNGQEGDNEKLAGSVLENGENRGAENKETKNEVTGKTTCNVGNPSSSSPSPIDLVAEKEMKGERKESRKREQKDSKFGNLKEGGKGLRDVINFSKGNEVIASASEAVTRMAKRFNEEDKQMMIYVGAAVIVTTVISVCASFTFRSLGRS